MAAIIAFGVGVARKRGRRGNLLLQRMDPGGVNPALGAKVAKSFVVVISLMGTY